VLHIYIYIYIYIYDISRLRVKIVEKLQKITRRERNRICYRTTTKRTEQHTARQYQFKRYDANCLRGMTSLMSIIVQQDATMYSLLYFCKSLYMFRVVTPLIIRSTYNCNYSIWHWSNRLCYLPLWWSRWNVVPTADINNINKCPTRCDYIHFIILLLLLLLCIIFL